MEQGLGQLWSLLSSPHSARQLEQGVSRTESEKGLSHLPLRVFVGLLCALANELFSTLVEDRSPIVFFSSPQSGRQHSNRRKGFGFRVPFLRPLLQNDDGNLAEEAVLKSPQKQWSSWKQRPMLGHWGALEIGIGGT